MSHPHGASSFENINRQGPSSVQSVTADTSPHMALEIKLETSGHVAQENQNQTNKNIALEILKEGKALATAKDEKTIAALSELAKKPFVIGSKSRLSLWERCFNFVSYIDFGSWSAFKTKGFKGICDKTVIHELVHELVVRVSNEVQQFDHRRFSNIFLQAPLFDAAEFGNAEFIIILIRSHPNIILTTNNFHQSLFHIAVKNRQESVFNLLNEIGPIREITLSYVDIHKQNILHLAGQLAPPSRLNVVPGAALQMQRELLWFKEVEKIVPPSYLKMRNSDNLTPWEVFTDKHKELRGEGQKWMKDTVNFYIVVATLITAVVSLQLSLYRVAPIQTQAPLLC